jgi:protein gp37
MTTIEWAHAGLGRGKTWNPIRASNGLMGDRMRIGWHCEKVSPACANCYAERQNLVGARGGTKLPYKPGHRANGDARVFLDEQTLLAPLSWKQPTGIFVCSMTDAFGDWVEDEWLDKMFAVAALRPQHRFIFLTKRPKRMRDYLTGVLTPARIASDGLHEATMSFPTREALVFNASWPLPNVWLGVTAEDQQCADERRDDLRALAERGWTTFVSYGPALGPVDWTGWEFVSQIIFEGESGPQARPSHPRWARDTRDFCAPRGIAFFLKQWGEWHTAAVRLSDGVAVFRQFETFQQWVNKANTWVNGGICLDKAGRILTNGADMARARDEGNFPVTIMHRVGRARAGRTLDGVEHNEFPEARL